MSDAIEEFGPYLVYEQLGQGGMATVHRAEKRGVGIRRPIALKRLLPHVAADPDLVKLFVDEARLASHLHHANVAQTYELGRVGDTFFIAMEYASGPTLSQIVRQCKKAAGEIPLTVTVNILGQVCEALDYAHNLCDESGRPLRIIHRDVSPANILVTNTGIVKLIDFGIAKATISSVKTQTGFIKGKFGYIAPEYITGKIDARVDLFAIGVVAHELLTGRRLFEGKDDFETLANIREMVMKPPSRWNPHVTADLDDIVMTALARDPAKRWQSAAAMQVALANVARELGVVVGSQQLVEWVEWAFSQVPRASGPMLAAEPNTGDTERHGHIPGTLGRDSSLDLEIEHGQADRREAATPRSGYRRALSPSELDETVPLERIRHVFNNLEVLTPPPIAVGRATRLPPPAIAASRETARLPTARAVVPVATPRSNKPAEPAPPPPIAPWMPRPTEPAEPAPPPPIAPWMTRSIEPAESAPPPPAAPWMTRSAEAAAPPALRPARSVDAGPPPPPQPRPAHAAEAGGHPPPPPQPPPVPPPRLLGSFEAVASSAPGAPGAPGPIDPLATTAAGPAPRAADPVIPPSAPREIAMIIVPPGTNFDKPPPTQPDPGKPAREPKPVEGSKPPRARPESKPAAKADARSARKPASQPGSYPIAPRKRRTVLWLVLLMLALGAGATVAAYYFSAEL